MKNNLFAFFILIISSVGFGYVLSSCSPSVDADKILNEQDTIKEGYFFVGHALADNKYIVSLYTDEEKPLMGATNLFIEIHTTEHQPVTDVSVQLFPLMSMGKMEHSCPFTEPTFDQQKGLFQAKVIFSMKHLWKIQLSINSAKAEIPMMVYTSKDTPKYMDVYTGSDDEMYYITRISPENFKKGVNQTVFLLNKQQDFMNFPSVDDLALTVETYSGQHSLVKDTLPENTTFTPLEKGFYGGEVNLLEGDSIKLFLRRGKDTLVKTEFISSGI